MKRRDFLRVRSVAKRLLDSFGMLGFVQQGRALGWATVAQEMRYGWLGAPDGFPIPPAHLRGLIVAQPVTTVSDYLVIGQACAQGVIDILATQGVALETVAPILDFGCGCGRVARSFWATQPASPSMAVISTRSRWRGVGCRYRLGT